MTVITGTLTRTVAVNAAFLQEIKEDNRELRRLLNLTGTMFAISDAGPVPTREIVDMISELRDQMAMHFSLEEAYGYFDDAINIAPRLSERADSLRNEHRTLFLDLCELVDEAEQLLYHEDTASTLARIGLRFEAFRHQFQEHETREEELILQSFDDDIGVGD